MNNMTKRLLICCCVLPFYAMAGEEGDEHKTGNLETATQESRTSEARVAETRRVEKIDVGNNTVSKEKPSKLEQFLALPPASAAAKKRMNKR